MPAPQQKRARREPPPADSVWDRPLAEADLAFVDLEMTGLDADKHRVIQVCIERVRGGECVDRILSFVHPGDGPIGGTEIHGIDASHVAEAPPFADVADRIVALLDGAVFVAHGAKWDIAFLVAELARLGRSWAPPPYLDTLSLSRQVVRVARHRLTALAEHLGIENPQPHRADNDVLVTRALFAHLVRELEPTSPRALWEVAVAKRRLRPEILARAQQALDLRREARVCYRPCGKPPWTLAFQVTEVRRDLDPPVVLGYLLETRGRRELRADRILSLELASDDPA